MGSRPIPNRTNAISEHELITEVQSLRPRFSTDTHAVNHTVQHVNELPAAERSSDGGVRAYLDSAQKTIENYTDCDITMDKDGVTKKLIFRRKVQSDALSQKEYEMKAVVYVRTDGTTTLATYGASDKN